MGQHPEMGNERGDMLSARTVPFVYQYFTKGPILAVETQKCENSGCQVDDFQMLKIYNNVELWSHIPTWSNFVQHTSRARFYQISLRLVRVYASYHSLVML